MAKKMYPIKDRANKVSVERFGKPGVPFLESLPDILAGGDFRKFVDAMNVAIHDHQDIVIMMGGHVIKCGCSPFIIEMIKAGFVTHVAMNGGAMIHDYEIGMFGGTSESVEKNLPAGKFGMWEETYEILEIPVAGSSLGYAVGSRILAKGKYLSHSILAGAARNDVRATVHTAIGADFIHDPQRDLFTLAWSLIRDLQLLDNTVNCLSPNAVVINFGSAVILPEIWLKCLSRAVNDGHDFSGITCANFDMGQPYRAIEQIVKRPRLLGATTYNFVGQHEILIPLLTKAVLDV